mmetsp:Transcript_26339/g.57088  ORF Transcript_26339/g.57088 Transcript_26339/m.57088 type:complete len:377 (-) Transcript_26339:165-1295(-)
MTPPAWRFLRPLASSTGKNTRSHRPKCRVVFAGRHFQAGLASTHALLQAHGRPQSADIELIHAPSRKELMEAAPKADVALPFMEHFDKEFIRAAQRLRLIQQFGVGLERVDIDEATAHGIAVSNVPAVGSGNAESTAEHAIMLAMMLLRHVPTDLPRRFEAGELGGLPLPRTLYGKNVTVVGYGSVGSTLCRYLISLGANVTAVRNRKWCPIQDKEVIAKKLPCIKEALPTTDVLILACTVTPVTWHLMNEETIDLLPDGALVVNVGRGPLVEYDAMLKALKSGKVGGFASDVGVSHPTKPSEPWDPIDELSLLPNTIFTPHVGGYCDISYGEGGSITAAVVESIECIIRCEAPPVWFNKPQSDVFKGSDPEFGSG